MKPPMQENRALELQVLTGDGETLASLAYPCGTRVWQVLEDVEQQIIESRCVSPINLRLRSSLGAALLPHKLLKKVLHLSRGDYIVAEFEQSGKKVKKHTGSHPENCVAARTRKRKMKQGRFDKPSSQDSIRGGVVKAERDRPVTRGGPFPGQERSGWGNYKIPKRDHPYSRRQPQDTDRESTLSNCTEAPQINHRTRRDRGQRNNDSEPGASSAESSCTKKTRGMHRSEDTVDGSDRTMCATTDVSSQRNHGKLQKDDSTNDKDCVENLNKSAKLEMKVTKKMKGNRDAKELQTDTEHSVKMTRSVKSKRTSIEEVAPNSALGSLIKNYTEEDDSEEEEEEDVEMEIQDSCGSIWKVTEPSKRPKNTNDDTNTSSKQKTTEKTNAKTDKRQSESNDRGEGSSSKQKTSEKTNAKKDQSQSESNDRGESGESSSSFKMGVGAFLQSLKSESEKPKQFSPTRVPNMQSSLKKLSSSSVFTNDWPPTKSIRTYSRQTPRLQVHDKRLSTSTTDISHTDESVCELKDSPSPVGDDENLSSSNVRQEEKLETKSRTPPVVPPISSRTRSGQISTGATEEVNNEDVGEEEEEEDVWQMDVVLLSIKCKGPISNKQLASCMNGIMLDLAAEGESALEALTVDEVQKKLESIYERDLSDKRTVIEYVFKKLKRDGPKKQKASSPVVVTIGKIGVTKTDMYTLVEHIWLNDNIINSYMHLLSKASKRKVFVHSTFFYTNLTKKTKGYESVKRWTDQIDLFSQDLVLVPVHMRNHWTLAAIHVQQHRIEYYNSLGSSNPKCMGVLIQYLRKEAEARQRHLFTALKWGTGFMRGTPQQMNSSDCGVYVCQYAKRLCLNQPVKFTTMEAINFRKEMVQEIVNAEISVS